MSIHTGRLTLANKDLRIPYRDKRNGVPTRVLTPAEVEQLFGTNEKEKIPMNQTTTTAIPPMTLQQLYDTYIVGQGKSFRWVAENSPHIDCSGGALRMRMVNAGIHKATSRRRKKPKKPAVKSALEPVAEPDALSRANGQAPVPEPVEPVETVEPAGQLAALQQLMATLQSRNIAVSGRVVLDLHIEMDVGGKNGNGHES